MIPKNIRQEHVIQAEIRDWTYVEDIGNGLLAIRAVEEAIGESINLG